MRERERERGETREVEEKREEEIEKQKERSLISISGMHHTETVRPDCTRVYYCMSKQIEMQTAAE